MSRLIYLATPYNSPNTAVRQRRFEQAVYAAAQLMRAGIHLFCPIAHTHPIAEAGDLPKGWDYWGEYDRLMLSACQELWVLLMPGWQESQGIKREIEIARSLGLSIRYIGWPLTEDNIVQVAASEVG